MIPYQDRTSPFKLGNATNTLVYPLGDATGLVEFRRSSLKSAAPRGGCDYALVSLSQLDKIFSDSGMTVALDHSSISLLSQRQSVNVPTFQKLAKAAGINLVGRKGIKDLKEFELEKFIQLPLSTQHNLQFQASWAGPTGPVTHLVAKIFLGMPKSSGTQVVYENFCVNNLTMENLSEGTAMEMNTFGRLATERLTAMRKRNTPRLVRADKALLEENASLKATNETMFQELEESRAFRAKVLEHLGSALE
jgi:hypothetical protein